MSKKRDLEIESEVEKTNRPVKCENHRKRREMRVVLRDLWKRRLICEHCWNYGECERWEGNRVWEVRAETTATREVRLGLCVMRGERWEVRWVGERENKSKKEKSEKLAFPSVFFFSTNVKNISEGENTKFIKIVKILLRFFSLISIIH